MIMTPPVLMQSLPINYGKLFKDCKRKLIFWRERHHASPMLHSSGNYRKRPRQSQKATQTPNRDPQKRKLALSDSDDASDDSDQDAVHAILGKDEQDGDSSDKLLKEIEEEYNTADKTGPNINEHLANLINKRFAGKLKEAKLKEKLELYVRPGNCEKLKVPLVNPELWGKLKPPVKSQDLRLANVQQTVVKATINQ